MAEISAIKMEARMLLNEVNQYFEWLPDDGRSFISSTIPAEYGEQYSFKEKLGRLKQKIREASSNSGWRKKSNRK